MSGGLFDSLEMDSEIAWPKRGRKKQPLPENLVNALHTSFSQGNTPMVSIPSDQLTRFTNLLNRAGRELNYRIERVIKEDSPEKGITTIYFRTRHRRSDDND